MSQADWIEEEPTYPTIPPNCPYFEGGLFWYPVSDDQSFAEFLNSVDLNCPTARFRTIISSVARCAWRDERDKYNAYADAGDKRGEQYKKWKECFDNENAWKLWGLSK